MSDRASCGYSGPKVKSDCRVFYEISDTELSIVVSEEKSTTILEDAIRKTAERMGIFRGIVEVENSGAAPFVAAARFEAAAREVLGNDFPSLPPARYIKPSGKNIPRRSRLYVPGNRPRFMEKALTSEADGVILDLEDSVSPDRKLEARIMVAHALANLDFGGMEVMVRINQGEYAIDDLDWIVPQPVQHILIPKVEIADQVSVIRDMVEKVSELCGRESGICRSH